MISRANTIHNHAALDECFFVCTCISAINQVFNSTNRLSMYGEQKLCLLWVVKFISLPCFFHCTKRSRLIDNKGLLVQIRKHSVFKRSQRLYVRNVSDAGQLNQLCIFDLLLQPFAQLRVSAMLRCNVF